MLVNEPAANGRNALDTTIDLTKPQSEPAEGMKRDKHTNNKHITALF